MYKSVNAYYIYIYVYVNTYIPVVLKDVNRYLRFNIRFTETNEFVKSIKECTQNNRYPKTY